jgi:hypothetical protein
MDTLSSDPNGLQNGPSVRAASHQVIGWWCLFDAGEVWEWGRVVLTNAYQQSLTSHSSVSETFLQHSANQDDQAGLSDTSH